MGTRRMARLSRATILPATLLVTGCLMHPERAREATLSEVGRDLGTRERDDEESLERGRRLAERARALEGQQELTILECFRLALDRSEALKIGGERLVQADTLKAEAIGMLLPSVTFHGQYTRDSDVITFGGIQFTPQERYEFWLHARQPLVEMRSFFAIDLARQVRKIESLTLRDQRDQLIFAVAAAFYETLSLESDVESLETAQERAAEQVRVLEARLRVGEAQTQDILLAKARLAETEAQLVQTRHDVESSRARLARLTGVRPFDRGLVDRFEVESDPGEVPRLVDRALERRLDLERARVAVERAESEKNVALADYLPTLALDFDHWTKMRGGFNELIDWTVSVNLEWRLFDGGQREARLARALSVIRQRQLEQESLENDIRQQVEEAVLAFRSFDRSMLALQTRAEAAQGSEERTTRRFRAGEGTNLDVLIAQAERESAERDLKRTRFARKLSAIRIRLAVGDLRTALKEDLP